jgi:hypothetical protein
MQESLEYTIILMTEISSCIFLFWISHRRDGVWEVPCLGLLIWCHPLYIVEPLEHDNIDFHMAKSTVSFMIHSYCILALS